MELRETPKTREALIETRLSLGMSVTALAREAGVSRETVRVAELGLPVSKLTQAKIVRVLGKTRAELFGDAA